jgi:hypothetical protein
MHIWMKKKTLKSSKKTMYTILILLTNIIMNGRFYNQNYKNIKKLMKTNMDGKMSPMMMWSFVQVIHT